MIAGVSLFPVKVLVFKLAVVQCEMVACWLARNLRCWVRVVLMVLACQLAFKLTAGVEGSVSKITVSLLAICR